MSSGDTSYFKAVKLGDFLSELPKSTLPASLASDNGTYPFFCSSSVVKYCNTYIQDKPTVLMGTGGTASVNFGNDKFAYSTDTWAFRSSHEEELKTEYIYRFLQHKLPEIDYLAFEGSGLKHLRKNDVKKLKLRVPANKLVTSKILSILRNVDTTIEKTEALIEKYQQIKAGLMHDLFTRGIGADGKLRPSREQAPELYQETPIGWLPKDWKYLKLKDLSNKITDGDHQTPIRAESGVYLLSARNVLDGKIALDDVDFVPEFEYERMIKRCHPEYGDILISCSGSVGRVSMVPNDLKCCLVRSAALVKPNRELVNSEYLETILQSSIMQLQIKSSQKQAAQPNLFQGPIECLLVPVAKLDEQVKISQYLSPIDRKLNSLEFDLEKFLSLKKGLMQDLLTGKVQVPINSAEAFNV